MERKTRLQELIAYCKKNKLQFIGTGNPDAKILIIGKECAIDRAHKDKEGNPDGEWQYDREIARNIQDWEYNLQNGIEQKDIPDFVNNGVWAGSQYNPLYPYKGQHFKRRVRSEKQKKVLNEHGTSPTWCTYQKLRNLLFDPENTYVDFHKHLFLTELSISTKAYSDGPNAKGTKESREERLRLIQETEFFKSFPIVILACGDYISQEQLCGTFGVKPRTESKYVRPGRSGCVCYYGENTPKIVMHTRQLSCGVSDNLLKEEIANKVNLFLLSGN